MGEGLEERGGCTDIVVDSISNAAAWVTEKTIGIVGDKRTW
jgi:hypothetical protein